MAICVTKPDIPKSVLAFLTLHTHQTPPVCTLQGILDNVYGSCVSFSSIAATFPNA